MSKPFFAGLGAVVSADIAVPEHEREVRFYSRVLSTGSTPLWREDDLMNNLGIPVIGLGERTAEYEELPMQWMPHIQVADVAQSVQHAMDGGGSVLLHQKSEDGTSQWAVLVDPNGAAFGIIPVIDAEAMPPLEDFPSPDDMGPMGRIAWLDLTIKDASSTRDYYRKVIGWNVDDVEMKDAGEPYVDHLMLGENGEPAAGICHARGVNRDLPSVWLLYLPVGDLDESLRRVEEEGGRVLKTTSRKEGSHGYAIVQDPVGVYFALVPA